MNRALSNVFSTNFLDHKTKINVAISIKPLEM